MSSVGISAFLADSWLNTLNNAAFVVPVPYFQLHTGQPGASGTSNVSATTSRASGVFSPATGGSFGFTGLPPIWSAMAAAETVAYVSAWDAASSGHFLFSGVLLSPKIVAQGDQFALGNFALSIGTLAA